MFCFYQKLTSVPNSIRQNFTQKQYKRKSTCKSLWSSRKQYEQNRGKSCQCTGIGAFSPCPNSYSMGPEMSKRTTTLNIFYSAKIQLPGIEKNPTEQYQYFTVKYQPYNNISHLKFVIHFYTRQTMNSLKKHSNFHEHQEPF